MPVFKGRKNKKRAQVFKHVEQSYNVTVGFKEWSQVVFVYSPYRQEQNHLLQKCVSTMTPWPSTRQVRFKTLVSLLWIFFSTRWARWSVICGLIWVWINLFKRGGKKLNKNTSKKTHTKAFLESIATSKSVQTKPHQHLQV